MGVIRLFNDNWKFLKTPLGTEVEDIAEKKEDFFPVDIPHDWLIYNTKDLYENSTGWYRKCFTVETYNKEEGERIELCFDGVYMDSSVYVNGYKAGEWKYGYSAFGIDITDMITEGENEILVQVRHQSPNSRWYSGAGIYRDVSLIKYPKVYIPLYGTYVSSKYVQKGCYRMEIETEVAGVTKHAYGCRYFLMENGCKCKELGETTEYTEQGGKRLYHHVVTAQSVKEWDIENPSCYQLRVELIGEENKELMDVEEITIGFKRMEFSPETGFWLNGRRVKLHGACEHHDLGCLGAAFHKEAMRRKLTILRGMGVNAIRTSHNMPARKVMELADEMGFLVLSEAFDMWERNKTEYDYARFFIDWSKRDVRSWIRRDRNHPSLLMWSIGNEIYDTHADDHGQEITARLAEFVKEHDPKGNGGITMGSNYMPWDGAQKCADILKLAGYNYGERCYDLHHAKHPDWIIYGSETCSVVQSRGVYRFPLSQSVLSDEDEQCSALGNSCTSWGAKSVEKCITDDRDADYSMGQFIWTGFDYIGEPTPYHTKNSYFGHVDTAGFPKDSYYIFASEWTNAALNPLVHLYPYWDFNEGQLIDVRACTNGSSVELLVNGESKGRYFIDHKKGKDLVAHWQVPYVSGEITAIAYDKNGKEMGRTSRHSFTDGVRLTIKADKYELRGNGEDLCFLTIGMEDKDGYPVENAMNYVEVQVSDKGRLLGLDNGDSTDYEPYKCNVRKLFNGKLLAVIGTKKEAGEIIVKVNSPGVDSAKVILHAIEAPTREGISCRENLMNTPAKLTTRIPVRKIELTAKEGQCLTKEQPSIEVEARVYPTNATDKKIIWKAVNAKGVEISHIRIEELDGSRGCQKVRLTAFGDGDFVLRAMSKSGTQKVWILSCLEFNAIGLGKPMLDPYSFVSAGLFTDTIGEIGNGNEKGIATARGERSGVFFENVDMREYGSDEVTIPIFALSDAPYQVELWLGKPGKAGSELLGKEIYQKPSIWNVYQEQTFKLPRKIKGVVTFGIVMEDKVHVKGFTFKKYEKAFAVHYATECNTVYGDSFFREEKAITGIGNNVTIGFEDMDFGKKGTKGIGIKSRSSLAGNTIHILFTDGNGKEVRRMIEVKGSPDYVVQECSFEPVYGPQKVELVFLPGCELDLESICFLPNF